MVGVCSDLSPGIELARGEVSAPLDGPVISHLDDPGTCCTSRAVKDRALALNEKEKVLTKIFRFCWVAEYAGGYAANDRGESLKKETQGL
jgi:hypothetical protein